MSPTGGALEALRSGARKRCDLIGLHEPTGSPRKPVARRQSDRARADFIGVRILLAGGSAKLLARRDCRGIGQRDRGLLQALERRQKIAQPIHCDPHPQTDFCARTKRLGHVRGPMSR